MPGWWVSASQGKFTLTPVTPSCWSPHVQQKYFTFIESPKPQMLSQATGAGRYSPGFSHSRVVFFSVAEPNTDSWAESEPAFLVSEPFPLFWLQHLSLRVSRCTWVTSTSQCHPHSSCWSKSTIPTTFLSPCLSDPWVRWFSSQNHPNYSSLCFGRAPAHALSHSTEVCDVHSPWASSKTSIARPGPGI